MTKEHCGEHAGRMPPIILGSIDRYVKNRINPGGFVTAVLENRLAESIQRADDISLRALPEIVKYCQEEIPQECWGSRLRVSKWIRGG